MALSPVAVLLLALLHERPMHPYQLHQTLVERHATRLVRVNPGAVYHGIEKLEREGLVEQEGVDREGRRPERTTYRLTAAGRSAFAAQVHGMLADVAPEYPAFRVALSEAHHLPADHVRGDLVGRLAAVRQTRDDVRAACADLVTRGLPRRFVLELEHEAAMLAADVAWLEGIVADLDSGALSWDDEPSLAWTLAKAARQAAHEAADDAPARRVSAPS